MRTFLHCLLCVVGALSVAAAETVIDASDLDALRAAAGTEVTVSGQVVDVGTTSDKGITFINISLPKRQGFTAVIFETNYGAFPDGFGKYEGQKVEVQGLLELFRGNLPQIILRSAEQIRIVEPGQ